MAAFAAALATVNVLSELHDHPGLNPWRPLVDEASSVVALLAMLWVPWIAVRSAPLGRPAWRRWAGVHGLALILFSALHVAGFALLRALAYRLHGASYRISPVADTFVYELRKDAIVYAIIVGVFYAAPRLIRPETSPPARPRTFDIVDGARVIRVPTNQILAVTSAGNYVEFHLADGRRPLMRRSLTALAAELPEAFTRIHRAWVVNADLVTALWPERSGDYRVEIGTLQAPLSRRYASALAKLRERGRPPEAS